MLAVGALAAVVPACSEDGSETLTIYSGREQSLVQPLLERFAEEEGVAIKVRYGDTAELAATLLEEGENSPADVFFAQDGGALGALDQAGAFQPVPEDVLAKVDERFQAPDGNWVGFSARARVVAYSTERVEAEELPSSILDFTDPEWRGRIGWAPTNGSFQSFVTELRQVEGEDGARAWLEGIQANDPVSYVSNIPAELGVADGEVDVAFVNHYYLYLLREEEGQDFPVENGFMAPGDPGSLVNVAGSGILSTSDSVEDAQRFMRFMLGVRPRSTSPRTRSSTPWPTVCRPTRSCGRSRRSNRPTCRWATWRTCRARWRCCRRRGCFPEPGARSRPPDRRRLVRPAARAHDRAGADPGGALRGVDRPSGEPRSVDHRGRALLPAEHPEPSPGREPRPASTVRGAFLRVLLRSSGRALAAVGPAPGRRAAQPAQPGAVRARDPRVRGRGAGGRSGRAAAALRRGVRAGVRARARVDRPRAVVLVGGAGRRRLRHAVRLRDRGLSGGAGGAGPGGVARAAGHRPRTPEPRPFPGGGFAPVRDPVARGEVPAPVGRGGGLAPVAGVAASEDPGPRGRGAVRRWRSPGGTSPCSTPSPRTA